MNLLVHFVIYGHSRCFESSQNCTSRKPIIHEMHSGSYDFLYLSNDTPLKKNLSLMSVFTQVIKANRQKSIFFLKSFISQCVFYIKALSSIMPTTMGLVVSPPPIVPPTIKQDDDILHNRSSVLNLLLSFSIQSKPFVIVFV